MDLSRRSRVWLKHKRPCLQLTNCHANGVYTDTPTPYAAFRMAPHVLIDGAGAALCNCHASDVSGAAAYQLYENDSPQRYSLINCYLASKRRYTKIGSRDVRDPDGGAPGGHAADGWELLEPAPEPGPEPEPELRAG